MFEDIKEDIFVKDQEYSMISLFSNKINVGVIGFGKGALIKAKHFISLGSNVLAIAKDEYSLAFIRDKHIILIAVDDDKLRTKIKEDCEKHFKIYIDCSNFRDGMGVVPSQRESKNIVFAVNTRNGNPKGSVFLGDILINELIKYDDYIEFTTSIRNKIKNRYDIKKEVLDFIFSEDFQFFFKKGRGIDILKIFYNEV